MDSLCPCQSQLAFTDCCQPLLTHKKHATSAEALMRSRFVAYHHSNWKYVFKTWHKSTRPSMVELRSAGSVEWLNLKVVRCEEGLVGDNKGLVEFVATYKDDNGIAQVKECSEFIYENRQWFYSGCA